eukprot:COSAG02_NODE_65864_length_257_cov_0.582278_1_plen_27_part_10
MYGMQTNECRERTVAKAAVQRIMLTVT